MNTTGVPAWDPEPDWQPAGADDGYEMPEIDERGYSVESTYTKRQPRSALPTAPLSIVADPKNSPADLLPVRITQMPTEFYVVAGVLSGLLLVCIAQLSAVLVEVYR